MKFQFFTRRMPSLYASVVTDASSISKVEDCALISHEDFRSSYQDMEEANDEIADKRLLFGWDCSDNFQVGKAESTLSTICTMIESEYSGGTYDPSTKHLYFSDHDHHSSVVDEKCRSKMLDWCFKMVDFFNIDRSIVSIATSYQDRFLSTSMGSPARTCRETFRVASVTCLYIAIKLYVPHKWNVTAHAFAELCRGTISGESIVAMEMQILFALGWNVHPPVPDSYVELILYLITTTATKGEADPRERIDMQDEDSVVGDLILPSLSNTSSDHSATQECTVTSIRENVIDLVRYQIELTLQKATFFRVRSSMVTIAAFLNAIEGIIGEDEAQDFTVTSYCRRIVAVIAKLMSSSKLCSKQELDEVRAAILCSVMAAPDGRFQSSLLLHNSTTGRDQDVSKSSPHSITSPTSPSSWNHRENEHYLSPQSVLSRVCAMHCQCDR